MHVCAQVSCHSTWRLLRSLGLGCPASDESNSGLDAASCRGVCQMGDAVQAWRNGRQIRMKEE